MSGQAKIYLLILGMWVVNYLPRLLPMVILSKLKIPQPVIDWLGFIPAAVLAAIIVPSVVMPDGQMNVSLHNDFLITSIPAFLIAIKTRNMVWTLVTGMFVMALVAK